MGENQICEEYSLTKDEFEKYSNDFAELNLADYVDLRVVYANLRNKVKSYEKDLAEMLKENEKLKKDIQKYAFSADSLRRDNEDLVKDNQILSAYKEAVETVCGGKNND